MSHSNPQRGRGSQVRQPVGGGEKQHPAGFNLYPQELRPAVLQGDFISPESEDAVYQVDKMVAQPGVEALESDVNDDVSVPASDSVQDVSIDALELPQNVAGQFRMLQPGDDIPDGIEIKVDLGGAQASTYTTNDKRGFLANYTGTELGYDTAASAVISGDRVNHHLTELYVFEAQDLFFTLRNTTAGSITVQDLVFSGYQFVVDEVSEVPPGIDPVPWPNEPVTPK